MTLSLQYTYMYAYASTQYVLEVTKDPAIGSNSALWEAIGPLLLSSANEDEAEVVKRAPILVVEPDIEVKELYSYPHT